VPPDRRDWFDVFGRELPGQEPVLLKQNHGILIDRHIEVEHPPARFGCAPCPPADTGPLRGRHEIDR
jgi:hypothetical protein